MEKGKIIKEIGVYVVAIAISLKLQTVLIDSDFLNFLLKPFGPYIESLPPSVGVPLALLIMGAVFILIPLILSILIVYKFTHRLAKTILIGAIVLFLLFSKLVLKGMEVALR